MVPPKRRKLTLPLRSKMLLWLVALFVLLALALLIAQLSLPQERIKAKLIEYLKESRGISPQIDGFRCTVLGTFRAGAIVAQTYAGDALTRLEANRVHGRLHLFSLLRRRVQLSGRAQAISIRVLRPGLEGIEAALGPTAFALDYSSLSRETRAGLSSASAQIAGIRGAKMALAVVDKPDSFILERAAWDVAPGSLSLEGELSRGDYPAFRLALQLRDLSIERVPFAAQFLAGTLSGDLQANGGLRSGLAEASLSLSVIHGVLKNQALRACNLEPICPLLRASPGSDSNELPFDSASVSLAANPYGVTFRSLALSSPEITVSGTGYASFAGKLSFLLQAQLGESGAYSVTVGGDLDSPEISCVPLKASKDIRSQ